MTPEIKMLIQFICENSERESIFLTPNPTWFISSISLLDKIAEIGLCTKEEIEVISNKIADIREIANNG